MPETSPRTAGDPRDESRRPERIATLLDRLAEAYPDAGLLLSFETPFQLLAATVLAARAPDEKVNEVTPRLFERFPDAASLAGGSFEEVAEIVHPTGFFRQKARRLIDISSALVERFGGEVPEGIDELTSLPGVGRKTAILVINHAYGIPAGVAVDTHVQRVARRLGWSAARDPDKMEAELRGIVPHERWIALQGLLAFHGRARCRTPKPYCRGCPVLELCPEPDKVDREP